MKTTISLWRIFSAVMYVSAFVLVFGYFITEYWYCDRFCQTSVIHVDGIPRDTVVLTDKFTGVRTYNSSVQVSPEEFPRLVSKSVTIHTFDNGEKAGIVYTGELNGVKFAAFEKVPGFRGNNVTGYWGNGNFVTTSNLLPTPFAILICVFIGVAVCAPLYLVLGLIKGILSLLRMLIPRPRKPAHAS